MTTTVYIALACLFFGIIVAVRFGRYEPLRPRDQIWTPDAMGCLMSIASLLVLAGIGCMYLGKLWL